MRDETPSHPNPEEARAARREQRAQRRDERRAEKEELRTTAESQHQMALRRTFGPSLPVETEVFLSAPHVLAKFNISEMTLWRWLERTDFPRPIYVTRRRYWKLSEIEQWQAEREASRQNNCEGEAAVHSQPRALTVS